MMSSSGDTPKTNGPFRLALPSHPEPSSSAKLEVVRDLLAALDSATIAGQRHLMERIIGLVGPDVARVTGQLTDRRRTIIARSLDELAREAARLVPDAGAFRRQAEVLMDVLSAS